MAGWYASVPIVDEAREAGEARWDAIEAFANARGLDVDDEATIDAFDEWANEDWYEGP